MVAKSLTFWIITFLFVLGVIGLATRVIPPILSTTRANQAEISNLKAELVKAEEFSTTLKNLQQQEAQLDAFYAQARAALPEKPEGEQLLLQLDGLVASLGIPGVTINVPVAVAAAAPVAATTETEGATDETAQATPAPTSELTISLTGNVDYLKTKSLLAKLHSLIRWNKIVSFDINKSGDTYSTTINATAAYKAAVPKVFSGTAQLLEQSKTLFSSFQSYATPPNFRAEGAYGRPSPFDAP